MYKRCNNGSGLLTSRYLVSLLALLVITGAMQVTWPFFEYSTISLYLPAVIFIAWYGGPGPAIVSVALSFLLTDFFFIKPHSLFWFSRHSDLIGLSLFAVPGPLAGVMSKPTRKAPPPLVIGSPLSRSETVQVMRDGKQVDDKLDESRRYLHAFFNNSLDAILVTNDEGDYIDANPTACALLGYTYEELTQLNFLDLTPVHFRQQGWAAWRRFLAEGSESGEYSTLHKDGQILQLEFRAVANVLPGVHVSSSRDMTARKQTEEARIREEQARKESQLQYEMLVQSLDGIVWEADPRTFMFTFVSKQAERILGYPLERWFEGPDFWPDHMHPDDREWAVKFCVEETGKLEDHQFEYRMIAADSSVVWLSDIVSVHVVEGQAVLLRGVMVDITERKRIEEKLRQSESQLAEAQKLTRVGGWNWEIQDKKNTWSEELYRICGLSPKETLSSYETFISLVHPDDRAVVKATFKHALQTKQPIDCHLHIIRPDGAERIIHCRGNTISDIDGIPIRMHGTVQDVTEHKQAEDALGEAERKYRSIFENAVEGIFQTTADGRFISANPALARMLGFDSPEELIRVRTNIAHDHYVNPRVREEFEQALEKNGFVFNFELEAYRKDRSKIWTSENVRAVRDAQGTILYYEGASQDITGRKRAETRSTAFASLAHKLSGARTAHNAGRIIAETADELFGWDSCTLDLYDAEHDLVHSILNIDMISGQRVSVPPLVSGQKPTPRGRRIIDRGPELILRPEPCEFDLDAVPTGDVSRPCAAIMTAPIRHSSRVIGVLSFQSYTTRAYDHLNLSDLQALSEHCAEALNRLHAENQLQSSEERYCDLVENSHDLICTHDLDGLILSANRAALEAVGYPTASYAAGKNLREILPPETRDQFNDYLKKIHADGVASGLVTVQTQTGEKRIWEYQNTLRTQGVAAPIVRGMARDITEQRRVEEALRESESFRRMIIEAEPECVKVVAPNYALLDMNPAGLRIFEATSREQVIGQSVLNLVAPESRSLFMEMHERVCRGESLVREFEIVGLKGTHRWMESHAAPLLDKRANVIARFAITRDVTQRKRTQESLEILRNLIDHSSDAIEVLEPNTLRFLDCNATAHQTLGYTREEFLALTAFDIDPVIDHSMVSRLAEDSEKSGFSIFESVHQRKDGSTFPVEINAKPIRLERNYLLAVVRDVTDRKRAESALRDAERKYRDIFENAGEGIFQSTPNGKFLAANPALAHMLGFASPEELIQSSSDIPRQMYVDPGRGEDLGRLLEEQGSVRDFECQVFRKDRRKIWISVNARVVGDEKVDIHYYEGTAQDITDRKQAEDGLMRQKEILQQIVDHIPVMITFTDSDGRIRLVNRVWQQTLGWSLDEILKEDFDLVARCYPTSPGRDDALGFIKAATGEWRDFKTQTREGSLIDTSWARVQLSDGTTIGIGQDVTARTRSELALRQAERKYRDIFENAGEGIFQSTPDGRFLAANPALAHMHGFASPEELMHSSPDISRQIYVDPSRREDFKRLLEEQGAVRHFEHQVFRKDRSKIWISVNARAVRDEKGEIQYYEGTAQDITDRKRAEEALRESEERYRDLVENSLDLICTHDLDGLVLSANRAAMELMGYSSGTYAGGLNFRQVLASEVRDQFDDYIKRIRTHGAAIGLMLVETRSGEKRIWEYHSTLRTEGIAAPIVRGVARDITERKRAAEALRESEARYRELFENARDAIYVQDLGGIYVSVNRAAERLSGYERSEIIGKHFGHFIAPDYLPLVRANMSKKLADMGETAYEIEVLSKDGQKVPVELSSALIFKHGVPVGIQGIARDITERKRAEQALRSYSRRLIDAQEAERQHISRELHDQIGQVLTAIRINLHTVGNSCETEESRSLVEQGVGLVDEAIEQVRNLSFELRPSLLDNLGLAAALRWYSDQYTQRTGIRTKSASNLPDGQLRLRQELETACFRIVQEALTNVVRHANAKNVFIDLKLVDHKIVLSIKDDGIGFKEPTNGDVSASQLGLRGMKERALALGGALVIKSGPAQGTEIRATFPTISKED
jgi:PAS domain S-box-containing protein